MSARCGGLAQPKLLIAFRHIDARDYNVEFSALREQQFINRTVLLDDAVDSPQGLESFLAAGGDISDKALLAAQDAVGADDTAVVIFTSGTTGSPKGAMIKHRALLTGARVENEH